MNTVNIEENKNYSSPKKIKLYKDIFWEAPWNEGYICNNCWKILPKKFYGKCECWEIDDFEVFYKNKELKNSFEELSNNDKYIELVAKVLEKDIWFIWWWNSDIESLNKDKLWLDGDWIKDLKSSISDLYSDFDFDDFYYFAELWVKKEYRWNDIAWELYRENIEKLKNRWEKYILVRTVKTSDVPYKWFLNEWYKEVYSYNDQQDRVLLVYKI